MAPVLSKLDQENPHVNIFEVDTNESPEIAAHFNIRSVPTIHFCEGREILYTFNGVTPFRDLQYVIDNINDEYFRKFGEFKSQAKKNYFYPILFVTIVFFISLLMVI
jgi:thioredoxin 1